MEYPNHVAGMDLSPAERVGEVACAGCGHQTETGIATGTARGNGTNDNGGCAEAPCGHSSWGLVRYPLAMVYAPCQNFGGLYDPDTALERGTLFAELDLPLEVGRGGGCTRRGSNGRGCSC